MSSIEQGKKKWVVPTAARGQWLRKGSSTPLRELRTVASSLMKMPKDDQPIIEYMACVALSIILGKESEPVWGYIIGPAGDGKTELIMSLQDWATKKNPKDMSEEPDRYAVFVSDLTTNAMVSANPINGKEVSLLPKLKDKLLVVKDFTVILCKHDQQKRELLGQLRDIFDGDHTKWSGTQGEQRAKGRIGFLAGCTAEIETMLRNSQLLGERAVICRTKRFPPKSRKEIHDMSKQVLKHADNKQTFKEDLRNFILAQIKRTEWYIRDLDEENARPIRTEKQNDKLCKIAALAVHARSQTLTDGTPISTETPNRLVQQLHHLANLHAMLDFRREVKGTDIAFMRRVAEDTIPIMRRRALKLLVRGFAETPMGWVEYGRLTRVMNCPDDKTVKRMMAIWREVKLIECSSKGKLKYRIAPEAREEMIFTKFLGAKAYVEPTSTRTA